VYSDLVEDSLEPLVIEIIFEKISLKLIVPLAAPEIFNLKYCSINPFVINTYVHFY